MWSDVMRTVKKLWMVLAVCIIIAAIISSLFRALTPWAKQYKGELESRLSLSLGKKVVIDNMETSWYWFYPVVKLEHVTIKNGKTKDLEIKKLLIGINFLSSLNHWQFEPGILYIDGVDLNLKQVDKGWQIEGLAGLDKGALKDESYQPILAWLLRQHKIILNNISGKVLFKNQLEAVVKHFDLTMVHSGEQFKIKADAWLQKGTYLQVRAKVKGWSPDSESLEIDKDKLDAKLYLLGHHLNLSLLHSLLPKNNWVLREGFGDVSLWLDWHFGNLAEAQSRLNLTNLTLEDTSHQKTQMLPFLKANLALSQSSTEWVLSADEIRFALGKQVWPENSLMLRLQKKGGRVKCYVKHLFIDALMPFLSSSLQGNFFSQLKPYGRLLDTQAYFKNGKLTYLLTNFIELGWSAGDKLPGVKHLRGALSWQPSEGLLELESKNARLRFQNRPAFIVNNFTTSLSWKELSHGLRIHLDNFVIENPEIVLSAGGDFDEVSQNTVGPMDWNAEVSARNLPKFIRFLPEKWLDPRWHGTLKQIKQMDKLTAAVKFQGLLKDFPFAHSSGTFQAKAHISGLDFLFSPFWPEVKDFDAYVQVDKESFNADVMHANLRGIPVSNGNMKIDNLGSGKETLLLHTNLDAPAAIAIAYLKATPLYASLKNKLQLKAAGVINLDLKLEVPLYSGNQRTLALSELHLKDNALEARYTNNHFKIEGVSGSLRFDELGVLEGQLDASFQGYPITANMQSVLEPARQLAVSLSGKTSMDVLASQVNLPMLSLMKGEFWFEGRLNFSSIPNKPLQTMHFTSSLQGVRIDLPRPFNKSEKREAPIVLDLDVTDKDLRFRADYDRGLRASLVFLKQRGKWLPKQGQIRLGDTEALILPSSGLEVKGVLTSFDATKWKQLFEKIPMSEITRLIFESITRVDVLIKKLDVGIRHFPDTAIKAQKETNDWTIWLNQNTIQGELRYQSQQQLFSGNFSKWRIEPLPESSTLTSELPSYTLEAKDIPNIDWRIENLQYAAQPLGKLSIRGNIDSKDKTAWRLESCIIETPFYQISAKGIMRSADASTKTEIEANMTISDLAKTLEFWKLSPVVSAKKGNLDFKGDWAGAFYDFSLTKLNGQFNMQFKNGYISNLDPETEKKIGVGKLLSILSLQTLPRRLTLDFTDLSRKGYSFDVFKGNFRVDKGLMTTDNSYINGPIAYVSMNGSLDIARQLYDMTLKVTPYLGASLPIVATIAGGPVAGIATWVASKIINKGMQKVSGYTYKISGPWKQPIVQQVSIHKVNQKGISIN